MLCLGLGKDHILALNVWFCRHKQLYLHLIVEMLICDMYTFECMHGLQKL